MGDPLAGRRAFQTMTLLDAAGKPTPEEHHYAYDSDGRLLAAAFGQTPDATMTQVKADASGSWYAENGSARLAATRLRAHYEYDAGGRLTVLNNWRDAIANGQYASTALLGSSRTYETGTDGRGLALSQSTWVKNPSAPGFATAPEATSSYGYDPQRDMLTSEAWANGAASPVTTSWTYDAAGDRNDASTDNLGRLLTRGGSSYTSDILGNRTTGPGGRQWAWDELGRMVFRRLPDGTKRHEVYDASGLRMDVHTATSADVGTRHLTFRYDGQSPYLTRTVGTRTVWNLLSPRGSEGEETVESVTGGNAWGTLSYALYDVRGDRIGTVNKAGAVSGRRMLDAWGAPRPGSAPAGPAGPAGAGMVSSIGHVTDDEDGGMVYMRARWYEPTSGRFISEDKAGDGGNWFSYCAGDPVNKMDESGTTVTELNTFQFAGMIGHALMAATIALAFAARGPHNAADRARLLGMAAATMAVAIASYGVALGLGTDFMAGGLMNKLLVYSSLGGAILGMIPAFVNGLSAAGNAGVATGAIVLLSFQAAILMGEMFAQEAEGMSGP